MTAEFKENTRVLTCDVKWIGLKLDNRSQRKCSFLTVVHETNTFKKKKNPLGRRVTANATCCAVEPRSKKNVLIPLLAYLDHQLVMKN